MQAMLGLAKSGIAQLVEKQREVLAPSLARVDTFSRERLSRKFQVGPLSLSRAQTRDLRLHAR